MCVYCKYVSLPWLITLTQPHCIHATGEQQYHDLQHCWGQRRFSPGWDLSAWRSGQHTAAAGLMCRCSLGYQPGQLRMWGSQNTRLEHL